jgi:hypothetical protein
MTEPDRMIAVGVLRTLWDRIAAAESAIGVDSSALEKMRRVVPDQMAANALWRFAVEKGWAKRDP